MPGIYAQKKSKADNSLTVMQSIDQFFRRHNSGRLVLMICPDKIDQDPAQAAALLQRKLLDSCVKSVSIQVKDGAAEGAKKLVEALVVAAFSVNLQTLKSIEVTGMEEVNHENLLAVMHDNFFVQHIKLPLNRIVQERATEIEARNQCISDYQHLGKKHLFGISGLAYGIGAAFGSLSATALAIVSDSFGLVTAFMAPAVSQALLPVFIVVGLALMCALPIVLMQSIINLRAYFIRRRYRELTSAHANVSSDVQLSLTDQQMAHCNHVIAALNQAQPALAIAPLVRSQSGQLLSLRAHHARFVATIAQLSAIKTPFTFLSTTTFNLLLNIAHSCGFDSNDVGPLPKIADEHIEAYLIDRDDVANEFSLRDLMYSLNPAKNRYERARISHDYDDRDRDHHDITYTDVNTAIKHIATDRVAKATVFVNSASLKQLVVACNSNTTLDELTLHFSKPLTQEDAHHVAQIIYRNAAHLRKINLPNTIFTDETIFKTIEDALRCNGAITQFNYMQNALCGERVVREARIKKILARNKTLRRERSPIAIGGVVGGVVGSALGFMSIGLPTYLAPILPAFLITLFNTVPLILLTIGAGVVIGTLIAMPFALHARFAARNASHELHATQSLQMQPSMKKTFVMSAQQFRQAMKQIDDKGVMQSVLSSQQKNSVQLTKKPDETKTTAKVKSLMRVTTEDGQQIENLQSIATLKSDTLLNACVTVPRFQFFATTNQVKNLTDGASLDGDALTVVKEAYQDYKAIKHFGATATA